MPRATSSSSASCRWPAAWRAATPTRASRSTTSSRSRRVGLVKAIDRFDLDREVRFATFAVPTIAGEIKRHFRDRGWMMRVPRDVQELSARIDRHARAADARRSGARPRSPSSRPPRRRASSRSLEALSAADAYRTMSLDEPLADGVGRARGDRRRRRRLRARRAAPACCAAASTSWPRASARSCACASTRASRSARSPSASAISQMHVSRLIRRSVDALRDTIVAPWPTAA